ncbi:polysaccharide biosynthesis tyrosine autokinase [Luteolibacter algae]|uniref:non-specific protein-tyrosine kinase n=1 Tax=Luteolibacter algae TaxID=454151 RepID=A0ABW5D7V8_9BACT
MPPSNRNRQSNDDNQDSFDDFDDFESSSELAQERIRQLVTDLIGRWYWIALGLVIGVLGALYFLSKAPQKFDATATLLVKQQTATVMAKDQVDEMDLKSDEAINTVAQRIKRAGLLTKLAMNQELIGMEGFFPQPVNWLPEWTDQWLGAKEGTETANAKTAELLNAKSDPEAIGRMIGGWVEVSVRRNTRLLDVKVSHSDPEIAKRIADAIAEEYIAELTGDRAQGRSSSYEILLTQSEQARTKLQTAQNALANYQRVLETLKDLEENETAVIELGRRYLAKHPKMISAQGQLKVYQERFLSEFDSVRQAAADSAYWEANRAEWDAEDQDANEHLQVARRLLAARASVLESEIESQNTVFNSILTRMQETDINQKSTEAEVEISSLANVPRQPSSPKKPLVLAGGSILGLGLGFFIALVLTQLDNKLHTVAQAAYVTHLPVLASVSNMPVKILDTIVRKKKILPSEMPEVQKQWSKHLLFRPGLTDTLYAEMFRNLRASVSLLGDERKRKITLFSSALPGEGKTLISTNFALASAQQGKKTLLLDLDLRKPSVHKMFGLKRDSHEFGSTEILAGLCGWRDALFTRTGEENLDIILSGKKAPSPGELLNTEKLRDLLAELVAEYDIIVIDSAPILAVPDTRLILPAVDNFCLVVRAEYVPKGAVRRVLKVLDEDGYKPSGIVFNGFVEKRRLISQNYSYGQYGKDNRYGYGSYGTYGSDD